MEDNRLTTRIKISQEILAKIARIDEFKGLWKGSIRLAPQILSRLKSWVIITSSGASTRIEGAQLSDEEVARLIRGLKTHAPKGRDEEEVAGYADLIGRVFDNWEDLKLTENYILQFHSILLKFSTKDIAHRGKYKTADNTVVMKTREGQTVVLFKPTPPYLVKPEMDAAIEWTQYQLHSNEIHSLLIIANFIFEFLAIHPFLDGNGRLSRALSNMLLLQSGYAYIPYVSLDEIIEERKTDYYLALRNTQKNHKTDHEDITPWLTFFLDALLEHAARATNLMESKQPEAILSEKQLIVHKLFNETTQLSVSDIEMQLKGAIPRPTIKQTLSRLVDLRFIERIGMGRGTRYRKIS